MMMILAIILLMFLIIYGIKLIKKLSKRTGITAATLYVLSVPFAFTSIYNLFTEISYSIHSFLNGIYYSELKDSAIFTLLLCFVFFITGFISHMLYLKRIKSELEKSVNIHKNNSK